MASKKKAGKKDKKTDEVRSQLARALADYDNLRKRMDKEKEELWTAFVARFVSRVLPVYDMLLDAQKHLEDSGIAITIEEFKRVLEDEGVEEIRVKVGNDFDEELFEAVEATETKSKDKKGTVAKVLQKGFKMKDGPVIRPAKVEVYN